MYDVPEMGSHALGPSNDKVEPTSEAASGSGPLNIPSLIYLGRFRRLLRSFGSNALLGGVRQVSLCAGDDSKGFETVRMSPAGIQSRAARVASSCERVLRGPRVIVAAKRRQRVYGP